MTFSIRELCGVLLIVGLILGWFLDHHKRGTQFAGLRSRIAAADESIVISADVIKALERELDSIKPSWRQVTERNHKGYLIGSDKLGPKVYTYRGDNKNRLLDTKGN